MRFPLYETLILLFCVGTLALSVYEFWRGDVFDAFFALERQLLIMAALVWLELRRFANDNKQD